MIKSKQTVRRTRSKRLTERWARWRLDGSKRREVFWKMRRYLRNL